MKLLCVRQFLCNSLMAFRKNRLPDIFLKERYEKDNQFIQVYDVFTPNFNRAPVTAKFYSKYESGETDDFNPEMLINLKRAKDMVPREKLVWPETTNQIYGWWPDPLVKIDKTDGRFYFPRMENEITKHGVHLLLSKEPKKR